MTEPATEAAPTAILTPPSPDEIAKFIKEQLGQDATVTHDTAAHIYTLQIGMDHSSPEAFKALLGEILVNPPPLQELHPQLIGWRVPKRKLEQVLDDYLPEEGTITASLLTNAIVKKGGDSFTRVSLQADGDHYLLRNIPSGVSRKKLFGGDITDVKIVVALPLSEESLHEGFAEKNKKQTKGEEPDKGEKTIDLGTSPIVVDMETGFDDMTQTLQLPTDRSITPGGTINPVYTTSVIMPDRRPKQKAASVVPRREKLEPTSHVAAVETRSELEQVTTHLKNLLGEEIHVRLNTIGEGPLKKPVYEVITHNGTAVEDKLLPRFMIADLREVRTGLKKDEAIKRVQWKLPRAVIIALYQEKNGQGMTTMNHLNDWAVSHDATLLINKKLGITPPSAAVIVGKDHYILTNIPDHIKPERLSDVEGIEVKPVMQITIPAALAHAAFKVVKPPENPKAAPTAAPAR